MAKEGLDGFFLYCQLDEKFELIEAEFGLKGFAILIKLLQRIYGEHGYYCEFDSDISLLLAAKWNVASSSGGADSSHRQLPKAEKSSLGGCPNLIDQVVTASVRRGIFDKTMYERYGILTSAGIQKRYLTATRKRVSTVLKNEYLLLSDVKNGKTDGRNEKTDGKNEKTDVHFEQSKVKYNICMCDKQDFEKFWNVYPKWANRIMAEQEWTQLITTTENLRSETLIKAAVNYADKCRIEKTPERFIKSPANWLRDGTWMEYTPENYKPPKQPKIENKSKNKFNDFNQRSYDYEQLERQLLQNRST